MAINITNLVLTAGACIASTNIIYKMIDFTSSKSLELITQIATKKVIGFEDIDNILLSSDLIVKLKNIKLLVIILKKKYPCKNKTDEEISNEINEAIDDYNTAKLDMHEINMSDLINLCIININNIIHKINIQLDLIYKDKEYYKTLYLSKWRLPDYTNLINDLKTNILIFNERLAEIIKFNNLII